MDLTYFNARWKRIESLRWNKFTFNRWLCRLMVQAATTSFRRCNSTVAGLFSHSCPSSCHPLRPTICHLVRWYFHSPPLMIILCTLSAYCILELLRDAFQSKVSVLQIILEVHKRNEMSSSNRNWKLNSLVAGTQSGIRLHLPSRSYLHHFCYSILLHNRLVLYKKR